MKQQLTSARQECVKEVEARVCTVQLENMFSISDDSVLIRNFILLLVSARVLAFGEVMSTFLYSICAG